MIIDCHGHYTAVPSTCMVSAEQIGKAVNLNSAGAVATDSKLATIRSARV